MSSEKGVLSRRMQMIGWLCALGVTFVIVDSAYLLRELPEIWRQSEPLGIDGEGVQFNLRVMTHMSLLGWIGGWGYLAGLVWLPFAVLAVIRALRQGSRPAWPDHAVIATLAIAIAVSVSLIHFTPLRDVSFCHFVL